MFLLFETPSPLLCIHLRCRGKEPGNRIQVFHLRGLMGEARAVMRDGKEVTQVLARPAHVQVGDVTPQGIEALSRGALRYWRSLMFQDSKIVQRSQGLGASDRRQAARIGWAEVFQF